MEFMIQIHFKTPIIEFTNVPFKGVISVDCNVFPGTSIVWYTFPHSNNNYCCAWLWNIYWDNPLVEHVDLIQILCKGMK